MLRDDTMRIIESEDQVASWYRNKIPRIQHGKRLFNKQYLFDEQVLELFGGEVVIEEKIDGKLKVNHLQRYHPDPQEFSVSETIYPTDSVHDHVIKYTSAPHHVWLNKIFIIDGKPEFRPMEYGSSIKYGTISLRTPTLEQIYMLLESFAGLQSHFGAPKIEGVVVKNYKKQLMGKWVNAEFEDKIRESEE